MTGFVYAIESGDAVKIGFSTDPVRRLVKVRSDAPAGCKLLGFVPGTIEQEKTLHDLLHGERIRGEWFSKGALVSHFLSVIPSYLPVRTPGLKSILKARGFTLAQVAARLSVDKATVTRWAQKRIPAERAGAVADITGIPLYELRPDIWAAPVVSASEAAE